MEKIDSGCLRTGQGDFPDQFGRLAKNIRASILAQVSLGAPFMAHTLKIIETL